jgi:hypothetical protein
MFIPSPEIAALDHHIAQIDADAKNNMAIFGLIAVGGCHSLLQLDCALHGVDGTGELHQHSVAPRLFSTN